jgi:hypothetical protein
VDSEVLGARLERLLIEPWTPSIRHLLYDYPNTILAEYAANRAKCGTSHPNPYQKRHNIHEEQSASATGFDEFSSVSCWPECYHHGFGGSAFWTHFKRRTNLLETRFTDQKGESTNGS